MGTTSVWLNDEEEAFMRRQMALAGESRLGSHIKRVYFGNLNPGEGVLADLRQNTEMSLDMLARIAKKEASVATGAGQTNDDRDLELRLLAANFLMLHMSIGRDGRAVIERYIDPKTVENFLKAKGE